MKSASRFAATILCAVWIFSLSGCGALTLLDVVAGATAEDSEATPAPTHEGAELLSSFGALPGEAETPGGYSQFKAISSAAKPISADEYTLDGKVLAEFPTCPLSDNGCYGIVEISGVFYIDADSDGQRDPTEEATAISDDGALSYYWDSISVYSDGYVGAIASASNDEMTIRVELTGYFELTEEGVKTLNGEFEVQVGDTYLVIATMGRTA